MTKRQLLQQFYVETAKLRNSLKIQGMPGQNLFDNGLGGATLLLIDQGCKTHSKRFDSDTEALRIAHRLVETAQGYAEHDTADPTPDDQPLQIDDIQWDTV